MHPEKYAKGPDDGNVFDPSETTKGETKATKEKFACIFEMQGYYLVFSGTLISAICLKCKFWKEGKVIQKLTYQG